MDVEKLEKIPILKKLRSMEEQAGKDVTLGRALGQARAGGAAAGAPDRAGGEEDHGPTATAVSTVYLGGLPAGLRASELKDALRERGAAPLKLSWQGFRHRAFLEYGDGPAAAAALRALQGLCVSGKSVQVELAHSQRGGGRKPARARDAANTTRAQTGAEPHSLT